MKAYLVALMEKDHAFVVDIFSEPTPTMSEGVVTAVVCEGTGNTFREAVMSIQYQVETRFPLWFWTKAKNECGTWPNHPSIDSAMDHLDRYTGPPPPGITHEEWTQEAMRAMWAYMVNMDRES